MLGTIYERSEMEENRHVKYRNEEDRMDEIKKM